MNRSGNRNERTERTIDREVLREKGEEATRRWYDLTGPGRIEVKRS